MMIVNSERCYTIQNKIEKTLDKKNNYKNEEYSLNKVLSF
jgi:hypothetical protein